MSQARQQKPFRDSWVLVDHRAAMRSPAVLAWLLQASAKPACESFFGSLDGLVTIVDVDVGITNASSSYCEAAGHSAPCTIVHCAGGSSCVAPAPPGACHRYIKTTYKEDSKCGEALESLQDLVGQVDAKDAFNKNGVFTGGGCEIAQTKTYHYGPPADSPADCTPSFVAV